MNLWTLIHRSVRFHFRAHLGVVLGAAIGAAALTGALLVGDSVRGTLRHFASLRLANVETALDGGDRFVREALGRDLGTNLPCAPVLRLAGVAVNSEKSTRANHVQVLGVNDQLLKIAPYGPQFPADSIDSVVLNTHLAQQLQAKSGDTVLLRIHKPSLLSRESPIAPQQDYSLGLRLRVHTVVADTNFGRFALTAGQTPVMNAFVPLKLLQEKLELPGRANLLLASEGTSESANAALKQHWQLPDAGLELRALPTLNVTDLRSKRVFIDPPLARTALALHTNATQVLTYFVNELRLNDRATPYSMVSAATAPLLPSDCKDDEILINQWLAEDLAAKAGDSLQLTYFVPGADQKLDENRRTFRIKAIVPLEGQYADRELMPEFPGIAKAEKTENWDAGFSINMSLIRQKDEDYWRDYRGAPKAFITLKAGQEMWGNRFGNLTAIRYPGTNGMDELASNLRATIDLREIGLSFAPVREQALAASNSPQDFGQLFLGLSFFLITSALILVGLLYQLGVEQRIREVGTLLAQGFTPRNVRTVMFSEAVLLATLGSGVGIVVGIFYAKGLLAALRTLWRDAVAGAALDFHFTWLSLVIGFLATVVMAGLTIFLVLRKQARRPAHELLSMPEELFLPTRSSRAAYAGLICALLALGIVGWGLTQRDSGSPGAFFGAGALLLISGIAFSSALLGRLAGAQRIGLSFSNMSVRGAVRRRRRTLATIGVLASGSFMIIAVGAFRIDANSAAESRASGTGGFALIGESTLPIVQNINTQEGRDFFNLGSLSNVAFVPFRVRGGDDASCLNLNMAQRPRLLGVKTDAMAQRKAFTFAGALPDHKADWNLLRANLPDGVIPAIADQNSIRWAMKKKLGDDLHYVNDRGEAIKVRLVGAVANSILQGNVLIDEAHFVKHFPGETGYKLFLIDAPRQNLEETSVELSRAFQDAGMELTPAVRRLNAFNAVQNTYLTTFQMLGGLGLLIGSAGLAVVLLRNVLERRGELALLQAVGYRKKSLVRLLLSEHALLLAAGLAIGTVSAVAAILPSLLAPGSQFGFFRVLGLLGIVLVAGFSGTLLATKFATRGSLLAALRSE